MVGPRALNRPHAGIPWRSHSHPEPPSPQSQQPTNPYRSHLVTGVKQAGWLSTWFGFAVCISGLDRTSLGMKKGSKVSKRGRATRTSNNVAGAAPGAPPALVVLD